MKTANISALSKPVSLAPVIRKANEYVRLMESMGKPVSSVALQPSQYDAILRSLNAKREDADKFDSLTIGLSVPVTRGAA